MARRIQGLNLAAALKNAFFRGSGKGIRTLIDRFLYPPQGIGTIADRLKERVERKNEVLCNVEVGRLRHEDSRIRAAQLRDGPRTTEIEARAFVSTVPLDELVRMLDPKPPAEVMGAASSLRFRDLIIVAVMLDRERATDQSWVYFPDHRTPFGRIHEPTNWSARMAPEGKTLIVAEQFCFKDDESWRASDEELADRTVASLHELGLISRREVLDTAVMRIAKAYPLFEVGYAQHCATVRNYLGRFSNLFLAGRSGTFSYHNMDHAMASGLDAADGVVRGSAEGQLEAGEQVAVPTRQSA